MLGCLKEIVCVGLKLSTAEVERTKKIKELLTVLSVCSEDKIVRISVM